MVNMWNSNVKVLNVNTFFSKHTVPYFWDEPRISFKDIKTGVAYLNLGKLRVRN